MASEYTSPEALDRVLALAADAVCRYEPSAFNDETAEYIAAAHPAFVASLIREVQRLREATTPRSMELLSR